MSGTSERLSPIPEIILNCEEERFWDKTIQGENDCIIWSGAACGDGRYGNFSIQGKVYSAHRISYKLAFGDPGRKLVLHKCNVTLCVNPDHLYLGDEFINMQQCVAEGRRNHKGEFHPGAKLSESDVIKIRKLQANGVGIANVCRLFLWVSKSTVESVFYYRSWKHIRVSPDT